MANTHYLRPLRFEFLTRFYDPLVRLTTREIAFKNALLNQAKLGENQTILDLACGSGTLALEIKKRCPKALVTGLDADAEILEMARRKAAAARVEIKFERGFSDQLPYADKTFDRVFSTLAFHHLTLDVKTATLLEILRVLKPGGEFHLADFALPRNKSQFILSKYVRLIDGNPTTIDNLRGRLMSLMERAGFAKIERTIYFKTIIGTIRLFRAVKN